MGSSDFRRFLYWRNVCRDLDLRDGEKCRPRFCLDIGYLYFRKSRHISLCRSPCLDERKVFRYFHSALKSQKRKLTFCSFLHYQAPTVSFLPYFRFQPNLWHVILVPLKYNQVILNAYLWITLQQENKY